MNRQLKIISGLTAFKVLGAILGILYMILQVRYFGTGRIIEVFFAAQSVLYVFTSLTQSGQLAEVFLPEYLKIKNRISENGAHKAYSVLINRLSIYILGLLLLALIFAPYLMKAFLPGFSIREQQEATMLFKVLLPLIFLQIHHAFLNIVLNAEKIFGRAEGVAILSNFISLLLLVFFHKELGVWVLVLSLYIGIIVQLLFSFFFARKKNITYYFIWRSYGFDHNSFFKTVFSTSSYTISTQILNWAFVASISFLPQGVLAIYKYVEKLVSKLDSILFQPFSVVFFTQISDKVSSKVSPQKLQKEIKQLQELGLMFGLFLFSMAVASGKEGLSILWRSEKFQEDDLTLAFLILISFFVAFTFQMFYTINRKYSIVLGLARYNYNIQAVSQIISAALSFALIRFAGIPGLLFSIFLIRIPLILIPFYINKVRGSDFYESPGKSFIIKFFGVFICLPIAIFLTKSQFLKSFVSPDNKWEDALQGFIWICLSTLVFFALIYLFKIGITASFKKRYLGKWQKSFGFKFF